MITRRKLRHVLVEATADVDMQDRAAWSGFRSGLVRMMGEAEYFVANPRFASRLGGNAFIISVNRGHEAKLIAALSFIKELGAARIGFYTIKTSGTIKALKTAYSHLYA